MKPSDRRAHPRLPLSLLVQFKLDSMDQFMREYASNISVGGMFIRTDNPHPLHSKIYLQFRLEDGVKLIEGLGEIVHINPPDSPNPGMGIEFINLDKESREFIDALIQERASELEED